jgi:hypothetical protein
MYTTRWVRANCRPSGFGSNQSCFDPYRSWINNPVFQSMWDFHLDRNYKRFLCSNQKMKTFPMTLFNVFGALSSLSPKVTRVSMREIFYSFLDWKEIQTDRKLTAALLPFFNYLTTEDRCIRPKIWVASRHLVNFITFLLCWRHIWNCFESLVVRE